MTKLENTLVWLYVKLWGKFGDHVINEKTLWTFSSDDLRTALMELAYPRKRKLQQKEKSERVKALTDLIMGKFENVTAFIEWSLRIHQDLNENKITINIVKWDPGYYSIFFRNIYRISMIYNDIMVYYNEYIMILYHIQYLMPC